MHSRFQTNIYGKVDEYIDQRLDRSTSYLAAIPSLRRPMLFTCVLLHALRLASPLLLKRLPHWSILSLNGVDRLRVSQLRSNLSFIFLPSRSNPLFQLLHDLGTNSFLDKSPGDCFPNCLLNAQVSSHSGIPTTDLLFLLGEIAIRSHLLRHRIFIEIRL